MTQPVAPPQLSPDGHWWWDGTEWVPAAQRPAVPEQPQPTPAPATVLPGYAEPVTIAPSFATPAYSYAPAPSQHDGMAITSLVLSLLWLMGLGSVGGIVLGHLSRSNAKKEGRQPSGVALAGIILGYVGAAFMAFFILAAIAIPVFLNQRVKADATEVKASLRNLAIAEETYRTDRGTYTANVADLASEGYVARGAVQVAIFRADPSGYCLGAHLHATTYYYDGQTLGTAPCS